MSIAQDTQLHPLIIKIRKLSVKHAWWMSLFALHLFYIFSFGVLILEHKKLSPHIMCKSNCKSEIIRCCLSLCIESLFNVFKVFKDLCGIVYSSTNSNKTVIAFKDFTLAGHFFFISEKLSKLDNKDGYSSFVFFQFNYSNHQSRNSIVIVFFFNIFC